MATSGPTITSLGVGSGLDLNSMLTQLVAVERQPLVQMQADASALQTKVSMIGQITGMVSNLQTAADAIDAPGLWNSSVASSTNSAAVSTVGSSSAAAGNYAVNVSALASGQTLASAAAFSDSSATVGSGTLTIQLGSWNTGATAFTAASGSSALTVSIASTDTLANVRDKINAAGAGVTAALVTDANGVRLSLQSTSTGAANGFRVGATSGLSTLAYDPPNGGTGMQLTQSAANAAATINGIAVSSATNDLSGVVSGLTIRLSQVTTAPVTVSVTPDQAGVTKAIQGFVDAYNALQGYITTQTKYDPTAKVGGPLQGNSTVVGLQQQLRAMLVMPSSASGTYKTLSDVGIQLQRDGTLAINQTQLATATANLPELQKAFATFNSSNLSAEGFAQRFSGLASNLTGVDGNLTTYTAGLQTQLQQNAANQDALNLQVANYQAQLTKQFTAMDTNLAQLNALSAYVTQQLAAMSATPKA
ncbi:MAG: flagellar filament capping protein FliD [Burkholderiales bacterium]|nr:flagellar filament capping protein FliD [Burkholderiales bacterium]